MGGEESCGINRDCAGDEIVRGEFPGARLATNGWLTGIPSSGPMPVTGLWDGKPMKEKEQEEYDGLTRGIVPPPVRTFRGDDPDVPIRVADGRSLGCTDSVQRAWDDSKWLRSGTVMEPCANGWDDVPKDAAVTFMMGVLQRWNEEREIYEKCRFIADARWGNMFTRAGEHPSLPSPSKLIAAADYCMNGADAPPLVQAKKEIREQIDFERLRAWKDLPDMTSAQANNAADHSPWSPAVAKIDLTLFFHQIALAIPDFAAWYHPEKKQNIAMGYVPFNGTLNANGFPKGAIGTKYKVHLPAKYSDTPGKPVDAVIVDIPFKESFNANTRDIKSA